MNGAGQVHVAPPGGAVVLAEQVVAKGNNVTADIGVRGIVIGGEVGGDNRVAESCRGVVGGVDSAAAIGTLWGQVGVAGDRAIQDG